ncbi:hypothetical protein TrVFT333_004644 [Trichoderma virens FT-333]|nr:hypothetical protein TrVFT333_004644 [Trichoderma virens FT-333]
MSLPSRGKLHFVYLTDPSKAAISSHKAAKAHAARYGHARIRRQRMDEYQEERKKQEGSTKATPKAAAKSSASGSRSALAANPRSSSYENEASHEMVLHLPRTRQSPVLETSPLSSIPKNINSVYGNEIDPTQQYLLHHYVSFVIPFGKRHCRKYTDSNVWKRFMLTELLPAALANPGLLSAILLSACRSLFEEAKNNRYVQLATYYKLACLRSMSELLATQNPQVGDSAIAQASLLAADELNIGDKDTSKQHMEAANRMVLMKGGSATLGMNGFLQAIVDTLTCALSRRDPMSCDMT